MSVFALPPSMAVSPEQVSAAVYSALNPSPGNKASGLDADKFLKGTPYAYPHILHIIDREPRCEDQVTFYCVSLLENYSHRTCIFRPEFMQIILQWLDKGRFAGFPGFIKNKVSQVVARCICEEYLTSWSTAVDELCSWWMRSPEHANIFLRICLSLNEELTCEIQDDKKIDPKITLVKDRLREGDVVHLVNIWKLLVTDHSQQSLLNLALRCISGYAPWIDVGLTANADLLQHIYSCLQSTDFRVPSIDCLTAIVGKGMPVSEKLKLVTYLNLQSVFIGAISLREEDEEFFEKSCRLLNVTGMSLLTCFDPLVQDYLLQTLVPLLTKYLQSSGSIECLLSMAPFSCSLPEYFKGQIAASAQCPPVLVDLFTALTDILKYPEEFDFDCPGETEELFPDLRQHYISAFDQLLNLCGSTGTKRILEKIALASDSSVDMKRRELALYLCFRYFDAHRGFSFVVSAGPSAERKFTPFGQLVYNSLNCRFESPFVLLTFMNLLCRVAQTPFFELFPDMLQTCFMSVMAVMSSADEEVLKKAYSTFNRLAKTQKIHSLSDTLINATLPHLCQFEYSHKQRELFLSKLEYYEAIGYCYGLLKSLSLRPFDDAFTTSTSLPKACNVIKAAGAFLKGFNDACEKQFPETEEVYRFSLHCITLLTNHPAGDSFETCKYFCQRVIGILRASASPILLKLILFSIDSKDEYSVAAAIQVLSAAVFKLKTEIVPLLEQVWEGLGACLQTLCLNDTNELARQSIFELERQTMALLIALFSSNIAETVLTISFQPYVAVAMRSLGEPDYALRRSALAVFSRFASLAEFPQLDLILSIIIQTVIPQSISSLKAINKTNVMEANHQAFIAEFCNLSLVLYKTKYAEDIRSLIASQASIDLSVVRDHKSIKSLLIQMIQH